MKVDSDDKSAFRYLNDDCPNYDYGKTAALVNLFVARLNDNLQNDLPVSANNDYPAGSHNS